MPALIELTSSGAVVPYGVCLDSGDCVWVAAKGGVFRFDRNGRCLFSEKYDHPKQTSAFSAIRYIRDGEEAGGGRILVKYADEHGCFLALYDIAGVRRATSILDSPVKSVAVAETGEVFLTSQPDTRRSELLRGRVDDLTTFETIATSAEFQFDQICCVPGKRSLIVSCSRLPTNPYSEQHLSIVDFDGRTLSTFSKAGKGAGDIHWPRAIEINEKGNAVVLDKTGRLQEFDSSDGRFVRLIDTIPAGLGNGFCIDETRNQFLVTCSGLVASEDGRAECNDWIEYTPMA